MPKLDKQGRLTIPYNIRHKTSLATAEDIIIFYEDGKLFVSAFSEDIFDKCIVSMQAIDKNGRIYMNSLLELIDSTKDDILVVAIVNSNICIFKK